MALEDKFTDISNEIESLKDGKLDKQKIKELIAEETAELHDIIDDTCGKVSQLEADRSEGWYLYNCLVSKYLAPSMNPCTEVSIYKDQIKIIKVF